MGIRKKGGKWHVRVKVAGHDIRRVAPTRRLAAEIEANLIHQRVRITNGLPPSAAVLRPELRPRRRVYFIQAGSDGPIKIGVAEHPPSRLSELQTSHFAPLRLVGDCAGSVAKERQIHNELEAFRLQGEWFEPAPEVLALIDRLAA